MSQIIQCKTYGDAIKTALEWLRSVGATNLEKAFEAKFGGFGMRTFDGSSGYRLEFDQRSGPHINVWHSKVQGPHFTFIGNEQDVRSKWRQLYWWDPRVKRRSNQDSKI
jgi:hypothetical protein